MNLNEIVASKLLVIESIPQKLWAIWQIIKGKITIVSYQITEKEFYGKPK